MTEREFEALKRRVKKIVIESEKEYKEAVKMYNAHKNSKYI